MVFAEVCHHARAKRLKQAVIGVNLIRPNCPPAVARVSQYLIYMDEDGTETKDNLSAGHPLHRGSLVSQSRNRGHCLVLLYGLT
jgi:hypothetical protein